MGRFSKGFRELAKCYAKQEIRYPHLKAVTLAQWALESDGGKSALATEHLNFGGLKWRLEMAGFAEKVAYEAHDGLDDYCKFRSLDAFIAGYWRFLERSPYAGWEEHTNTPEDFIGFIGPIYCPPNPSYLSNVLSLLPEAETLLEETKDSEIAHRSTRMEREQEMQKPKIKKFIQALYFSSRNNAQIQRIVLHYTTASTAQSTISWFTSEANTKHTSAHYIIDKNGDIYQMVQDEDAAHHCKGVNQNSIGIEHVARQGEHLTPAQEEATVSLIKWLMSEYHIQPGNITGHNYTPGYTGSTDCPHSLFGEQNEAAVEAWVNRHFA